MITSNDMSLQLHISLLNDALTISIGPRLDPTANHLLPTPNGTEKYQYHNDHRSNEDAYDPVWIGIGLQVQIVKARGGG